MALTWKHPFTCLVAGPTGSGKTVFTTKLVANATKVIQPPPQRIVWCYGVYQDSYKNIKNVEFHEGLPDLNTFDGSQPSLLILDDLMHETDDRVSQIFTRASHHKNVSVIFIVQNLFFGSKHSRTIGLNSHYIVLFKNARDAAQITYLARQMYPGKSSFMVEAFRDATSTPYSYLLIDLKPDTEENMRVRTNVFPEETAYVYLPK